MEKVFYSPLFFTISRDNETFLASFVRIGLHGDKEDEEKIKPQIELIRKIPNFEMLNAQMMWVAMNAYALFGDTIREKKINFDDPSEVESVLQGTYISKMIRDVFPHKKDTNETDDEIRFLYEKITREVYLYVSMLLDAS